MLLSAALPPLSVPVLSLLLSSVLSLPCPLPSDDDVALPLGVFVPQAVFENGTLMEKADNDFGDAIQLALHHIRERSCVLSGYRLQLIFKSTQCAPSLGVRALFEVIAAPSRPLALLGGFCTVVNEPVAMALKYWQIVQLSYAETHPKFASADAQEVYPTFFRIVPGDRSTNEAKVRLISHFGWKRVGTIRQSDEPRYALADEKLSSLLEQSGKVDVIYTAGITHHEADSIGGQLDELKRRDSRIMVLDVEEDMVVAVACEAFSREMFGEKYVWILPGYHKQHWTASATSNCTADQIAAVLDGHFAVEFATQRRDSWKKVVSGKSAAHVMEELSSSHGAGIWSGFLYDGLFTLAFALETALRDGGVDSFSYPKMLSAITNVSFEGVTGRVRFERNERLGLVRILHHRDGTYREVAIYDGTDNTFRFDDQALDGWTAPRDATIVERRREHISTSLFVVFSLFSLVGIALALIFLFVNIRYRNHRFIKMSSPNLNNTIIIGSMFTYGSVILIGMDSSRVSSSSLLRLCYARTWILCLGFTLAFGSMFSKTWRVHSIFTNIRMDKKAIKDYRLLLMLGVLLMLDVVVLSLWAFLSPFHVQVQDLPSIAEANLVIIPEVEMCVSDFSVAFQLVLYVIKGILMILGCFLAWETRHVNVPALNDSKHIGMSVYNVVVTSVLGLSLAFILKDRVNEAFALSSLFVIFATTCTLCLLFVPKVVELMRNPQGVEQRGYRRGLMKSMVTKNNTSISPHSMHSEKDLLARMHTENELRHRILHQKSSQLWGLLEKLKELGDESFIQEWCFSLPATASSTDPGGATTTAPPTSDTQAADSSAGRATDETSNRLNEWAPCEAEQSSTLL